MPATLLPILLQEERVAFARNSQWQVFDATGQRKYLNAYERRRFLTTADSLPADRRALCYVLAYTGCRISEALALIREQIETDPPMLRFRTLKRRRLMFRTVPVPLELVTRLLALPKAADGLIWHMHRATAWRCVKGVAVTSGIYGPMACCKGLRHGFGIHAIANNVPGNLVQRWLGHASSATTSIYLDAVGVEERQFAERMW
ncbi:site-specific integrase [Sphingomonas sp. CBMAI 2297]|uniref:tyrosine-type recombinase/integrase n=1 Tax=Sphingomonas sp. CBMAI 2297 TaxID=2991720 RepID=UPI002455E0FF|nr:site-specific integrase [Sphingomonas sp. CBMAI 2297]MDH4745880.1 site-specific integrase [Sphingomonas sp. CBMAI 2297]